MLSDYIPSLKATFTEHSKEYSGLESHHFNGISLNNDSPDVIVNIMKTRDPEILKSYTNEVVWRMFPTIGSRIFTGGVPKSDYWDQVC